MCELVSLFLFTITKLIYDGNYSSYLVLLQYISVLVLVLVLLHTNVCKD